MGNLLSIGDTDKNSSPNYTISIKSGNKHRIGSASKICIAFTNTDGRSEEIKHECKRGQEFDAGTHRDICIFGVPDMGQLEAMELTQLEGKEWYVEVVRVLDCFTLQTFVFPVHRWLKPGKKIKMHIYDCLLPQDDTNIAKRKEELEEKRTIYEFDWPIPGAMGLHKNIPADEDFSTDDLNKLLSVRSSLKFQALKTLLTTSKWVNFTDLTNVYGGEFYAPPDRQWLEDYDFGARTFQGINPATIRLCQTIPDNLPVTNRILQPIMDNMTIKEAIEKKKLFIINLANLEDLPCTFKKNMGKLCSPIALFFMDKHKDLMPVAIQLHQKPSKDNPIFLPTDPQFTWLNAKLWFQNADSTDHQTASHLGLTHFVMNSVCVAVHRTLSPSHPIFRLLVPHFYNNMAINTRSKKVLLGDDGWMNKNLLCGIAGLNENIKRTFQNYRLDVQGNLPNDLNDRGVADPEVLSDYYYRDDGLLYWDIIKKYVTTVVEGHYGNSKLDGDLEIQDFARVLVAESGCGLKGVPGDGVFSTRAQLIETLTSFIHISSVLHAAVNSPQYDNYSSPFASMTIRGSPPTNKKPVDENHIMTILADKKTVIQNMVMAQVLSSAGSNSAGSNRLGDPEMVYQYDPIGTKASQEFRNDLKSIEKIIDERNKARTFPYWYLHPKEVTNSIGI